MSDEPLAFSPDQFSGQARMFPLPNLVMFPHVMQALHIFEPRYRALFEEAIEDDRLIALGSLGPRLGGRLRGAATAAAHGLPLSDRHAPADRRRHLQRARAGGASAATASGTPAQEALSGRRVGDRRRLRAGRRRGGSGDGPPAAASGGLQAGDAPDSQRLRAARSTARQPDHARHARPTSWPTRIDLDLETKIQLLAECDVFRRTKLLLEAIEARATVGARADVSPGFQRQLDACGRPSRPRAGRRLYTPVGHDRE